MNMRTFKMTKDVLPKKWRCAFVPFVFVCVSYILCSGMWNIDLKKKIPTYLPYFFFSMLHQSNNFFLRLTCLLILTYRAILLYIVVARTKKWLSRAIGQSNCRSLLLPCMLGVADHRLKLDPTLKMDMTSQCFSSILHTSISATFLLPRVFTCQEKSSVCDSILPNINT